MRTPVLADGSVWANAAPPIAETRLPGGPHLRALLVAVALALAAQAYAGQIGDLMRPMRSAPTQRIVRTTGRSGP